MWFIMAQEQRAYDLSERLIRSITGWNYTACDNDIEDLIRQGAEVNRLHGTLLPLHCASMAGHTESVQLLMEHGAQVNLTDGFGRGPVHYAAERNPNCLQLLLDHGADPNTLDPNQDTPLHWAAFKNKKRCVRLLLQSGADVDAVDYNGDTPLCWAAMKGNLDTIRILLEYNANVDVTNCDGKTPISRLSSLIASGLDSASDVQCLELLIKALGQFDLRENARMPDFVEGDNRLGEMLTVCCTSPRSLRQLCRFAIRRQLGNGRYLPNVVSSLPLPNQMMKYLLLES